MLAGIQSLVVTHNNLDIHPLSTSLDHGNGLRMAQFLEKDITSINI